MGETSGGKKPWLSTTLWVNLIAAVAALAYPPAAEWMAANPETVMGVFAGINVVLRLITKEAITLK